jgi:hypothetical protein
LPAELVAWVVPLTLALDARQHPRFAAPPLTELLYPR